MANELFLRNLWYFGARGSDIKPGTTRRVMLLGEPVAVGRTKGGDVFALRDICPHRGVPLTAGRLHADGTIECPYHGWRFGTDGVCIAIPSLAGGEAVVPSNIRVPSFPAREQDGLIWIFMPAGAQAVPATPPPRIGLEKPRWMESQIFHCGIDHAVIGLMDPAHAPYVHAHWWWRVKPRLKEKTYAPRGTGFVMSRHAPSKRAYKLLGADVSTEITFELPSTRIETIEGTLAGRPAKVVGLTVCTPRSADITEVTQFFYWPRWLGFIRPFFMVLGPAFLRDDRKIVELQREGLLFNPALMLIQDADQPAIWYHRLKKTWAESIASGTPFVNPVTPRTLKWRS